MERRAILGVFVGVVVAIAVTVAHAVPSGPEPKKPPKRHGEMYRDGKLPVPAIFRVAVTTDRPAYVLGENVLVHFHIENSGTKPFDIDHGGDYRGAPRHTRFIVTATPLDATVAGGKDAPDPYPIINHMGGLGGQQTLARGERFEQSLPLMHYVHIPAAGEYVIRVSHDLGWQASVNGVSVTAETRVRFTMPDEAAAKRVIETMAALPARDATFGKRSDDYSDFSVLRYAIYLPALEARLSYDTGVEAQHRIGREAMTAIERMPDPAAVKTLLRLAEGNDGLAAGRIAAALTHHLPAAASDKAWAPAERFPADFSWREEFAGDVREFAARLLAMETSSENVAWGAALLKHVGRSEDLSAVIAAMNHVIPLMPKTPYTDGIFSAPRNTMASLQMAAVDLLSRGGKPPAEPKTPGEIVAYLVSLRSDPASAAATAQSSPPPPPPEFAARITAWSAHPMPYVRELSLNASPVAPSDAMRARLPGLIEDDDINVRMAAARLAQRAKETSCGPAVLRRLKAATTHWELDQQASVAADVGVQVDAWHIMAGRLDEQKLSFTLLRNLCGVAKTSGGFGWREDAATPVEIKRVKARWQAFLKEHEAELRAGKRFKVGGAEFTPDLLPPEFTISTPTGDWPPPPQQAK